MLGEVYDIYETFLSETHLLIGGTTGSGKSVVINGMIYNLLYNDPNEYRMVLIDPKMVSLMKYRNLPHVERYANTERDMIKAIKNVEAEMMRRYSVMTYEGEEDYSGGHIYVFIDELSDLMTTCRKDIILPLRRIAQLGRAAKIHLVCATQRPSAIVIPPEIRCNFTGKVGLHCMSVRESEMIIDDSRLVSLPKYGNCIAQIGGEDLGRLEVPMYSKDEIMEVIAHWEALAA